MLPAGSGGSCGNSKHETYELAGCRAENPGSGGGTGPPSWTYWASLRKESHQEAPWSWWPDSLKSGGMPPHFLLLLLLRADIAGETTMRVITWEKKTMTNDLLKDIYQKGPRDSEPPPFCLPPVSGLDPDMTAQPGCVGHPPSTTPDEWRARKRSWRTRRQCDSEAWLHPNLRVEQSAKQSDLFVRDVGLMAAEGTADDRGGRLSWRHIKKGPRINNFPLNQKQ